MNKEKRKFFHHEYFSSNFLRMQPRRSGNLFIELKMNICSAQASNIIKCHKISEDLLNLKLSPWKERFQREFLIPKFLCMDHRKNMEM